MTSFGATETNDVFVIDSIERPTPD